MSSDKVAVTVTGLAGDVTVAALRASFANHGYISSVELHESENGSTATVTFGTRPAVDAAAAAVLAFSTPAPHSCAKSEKGLGVEFMSKSDASAAAGQEIPSQPQQQPSAVTAQSPHLQPPPHQQPPAFQQPPTYQQPPSAYGGHLQSYGGYPPPYAGAPGWPGDPSMYWQQQPPPPAYYGGMPAMPAQHAGKPGGGMRVGAASGPAKKPLEGNEVKLFVGGLPLDATEVDLRALMGPYGNIVDAHLMAPSQTSSQRCAFVTFEHHVSALAATKLGGTHQMIPGERPIVVRFADQQGNKRARS